MYPFKAFIVHYNYVQVGFNNESLATLRKCMACSKKVSKKSKVNECIVGFLQLQKKKKAQLHTSEEGLRVLLM